MSSYASMGRGLSALLGNGASDLPDAPDRVLPIDSIKPFQFQRRRYFRPQAIAHLAESIRQVGIIQPLLVRPTAFSGTYELIAGEQRLRAAKVAELTEVPVIIRELTDLEAREMHLAENLLREDLNPVDETEGILEFLSSRLNETVDGVLAHLYQMQNDAAGKTTHNVMSNPQSQVIEEVFGRLGMKWSSFISNRLPVLNLPEGILEALREGKLEYTKASAIARVKDESAQAALLEAAIVDDLSLSEIKAQVTALKPERRRAPTTRSEMEDTVKLLKQAKVWEDPIKEKKLIRLMGQLRSLLDD